MGVGLDDWKGYWWGLERWRGVVYPFPRVAETRYCKFGGLKQQKCIIAEFFFKYIYIFFNSNFFIFFIFLF